MKHSNTSVGSSIQLLAAHLIITRAEHLKPCKKKARRPHGLWQSALLQMDFTAPGLVLAETKQHEIPLTSSPLRLKG